MVKRRRINPFKLIRNVAYVALLLLVCIASISNVGLLEKEQTERYTITSPYNRTALATNPLAGQTLGSPITPPPHCIAKGWVLMDATSKRVILSSNPDQKLPMASTTKILTALITLEQENLDDYFTVDTHAITVEGSSMGLIEGDKATLRTLAMGMLLPSANDGARAAAVRIAGSEQQFSEQMNAYAQAIGMENSNFTTASGLDVGEHYSTAQDMALLASVALQNEDFLKISSSKSMQAVYGNPPYSRTLYNHNKLLSVYDNAIGLKTGFTKKAGRCLVSAAQKDGLTLVFVTLNGADDFNAHRAMYEWAFDSLQFVDASDPVQSASIAVVGGQKQRVSLETPWALGAHMTEEEAAHLRVSLQIPSFVYAPVAKGQYIGEAVLYLADTKIAICPIMAAEEIPELPKKSFWERVRR